MDKIEDFIESVWHFLKADVHVLVKVFMLFFALIGICCILCSIVECLRNKIYPKKYTKKMPSIYHLFILQILMY